MIWRRAGFSSEAEQCLQWSRMIVFSFTASLCRKSKARQGQGAELDNRR
jgi:hypothetical protein